MTDRLYYRDAYLTSFSANVVSHADGGRRLYLDQTAFYPTSGGQPHDLGALNGVPVEDVVDEDDRVAHVLTSPVLAENVRGEIDWTRRFDFMQQHTGQHLISAVFADSFSRPTVSVHFGTESSTLDLEGDVLDDDALRRAEHESNRIVLENREIVVSFEDAATAQGLRKAPPREGILRVISIDGVDRSACGGTHVRRTGEIGPVLLRRQEKVRKTARVEFVCGLRALERARRDFEALSRIGHQLSASIDDVPALVESQGEQLRELQNRARRVDAELSAFRARARYESTAPDAMGVRRAIERQRSGSPDEWRPFALAYCELPKAVFMAVSEDPPSLLLAASSDAGVDAGKTLKAAITSAGGRGGGSPRMAQGSVPSLEALEGTLRELGFPSH